MSTTVMEVVIRTDRYDYEQQIDAAAEKYYQGAFKWLRFSCQNSREAKIINKTMQSKYPDIKVQMSIIYA